MTEEPYNIALRTLMRLDEMLRAPHAQTDVVARAGRIERRLDLPEVTT